MNWSASCWYALHRFFFRSGASMKLTMPRFDQAPVLVVGDVMLDRYWYGDTSRISPEAPVPVVKVEQIEDRPGGAANVALNIAALGGPVALVGVTGEDEARQSLADSLAAAGVQAYFQRIEHQPRSEEHTSELQSRENLVCRLRREQKNDRQ